MNVSDLEIRLLVIELLLECVDENGYVSYSKLSNKKEEVTRQIRELIKLKNTVLL